MIFSLSFNQLTKLLIALAYVTFNQATGPTNCLQLAGGLANAGLRHIRAVKFAGPTTTTARPPSITTTPTATTIAERLAGKLDTDAAAGYAASAGSTLPSIRQLTQELGYTPLGAGINSGVPKFSNSNKNSAAAPGQPHRYKLPSWFNYELYKRFYGKHYAKSGDNEIHKRIYLRTALKVFEQRALYRASRVSSLPSINELSDMTSEELEAFKHPASNGKQRSPVRSRKPGLLATATELECCTYDQVYSRIIELLNKTSSGAGGDGEGDLALSRALVEELEQKSLVEEANEQQQQQLAAANDATSAANDDYDDDGGAGSLAAAPDGAPLVVDGNVNGAPASDSSASAASGLQRQPKIIKSSTLWKPMMTSDSKAAAPAKYLQQQHIGSSSSAKRNATAYLAAGLAAAQDEKLARLIEPSGLADDHRSHRAGGGGSPSMPAGLSGAAGSRSERDGVLLAEPAAAGPVSGAHPLPAARPPTASGHPSAPQPASMARGGEPQQHAGRKQSALMGASEADEIGRTASRPFRPPPPKLPSQQRAGSLQPQQSSSNLLPLQLQLRSATSRGAGSGSGAEIRQPSGARPPLVDEPPLNVNQRSGGGFAAISAKTEAARPPMRPQPQQQAGSRTPEVGDNAPAQAAVAALGEPFEHQQQPAKSLATRSTILYPVPLAPGKPLSPPSKRDGAGAAGGGSGWPVATSASAAAKPSASFAGGSPPPMDSGPAAGSSSGALASITSMRMGAGGQQPAARKLSLLQPAAFGAAGFARNDNSAAVTIGRDHKAPLMQTDGTATTYANPARGQEDPAVGRANDDDNDDAAAAELPELSAAERSIAESVRRQVEQQLSANSTIGRQLTEQFSAYFGEPVLVRASVDESAVKRALVSARGASKGGSAGGAPQPSGAAPNRK